MAKRKCRLLDDSDDDDNDDRQAITDQTNEKESDGALDKGSVVFDDDGDQQDEYGYGDADAFNDHHLPEAAAGDGAANDQATGCAPDAESDDVMCLDDSQEDVHGASGAGAGASSSARAGSSGLGPSRAAAAPGRPTVTAGDNRPHWQHVGEDEGVRYGYGEDVEDEDEVCIVEPGPARLMAPAGAIGPFASLPWSTANPSDWPPGPGASAGQGLADPCWPCPCPGLPFARPVQLLVQLEASFIRYDQQFGGACRPVPRVRTGVTTDGFPTYRVTGGKASGAEVDLARLPQMGSGTGKAGGKGKRKREPSTAGPSRKTTATGTGTGKGSTVRVHIPGDEDENFGNDDDDGNAWQDARSKGPARAGAGAAAPRIPTLPAPRPQAPAALQRAAAAAAVSLHVQARGPTVLRPGSGMLPPLPPPPPRPMLGQPRPPGMGHVSGAGAGALRATSSGNTGGAGARSLDSAAGGPAGQAAGTARPSGLSVGGSARPGGGASNTAGAAASGAGGFLRPPLASSASSNSGAAWAGKLNASTSSSNSKPSDPFAAAAASKARALAKLAGAGVAGQGSSAGTGLVSSGPASSSSSKLRPRGTVLDQLAASARAGVAGAGAGAGAASCHAPHGKGKGSSSGSAAAGIDFESVYTGTASGLVYGGQDLYDPGAGHDDGGLSFDPLATDALARADGPRGRGRAPAGDGLHWEGVGSMVWS